MPRSLSIFGQLGKNIFFPFFYFRSFSLSMGFESFRNSREIPERSFLVTLDRKWVRVF